ERAADEIVEGPAQRAGDLPRQRLRHVGADDVLLPQKVVAGDDPPVRSGGFHVPMREVLRVELETTEPRLQWPDFEKPSPRALEQTVIALGALRVIALDIDDVPALDQFWLRRERRRIIHAGHPPPPLRRQSLRDAPSRPFAAG